MATSTTTTQWPRRGENDWNITRDCLETQHKHEIACVLVLDSDANATSEDDIRSGATTVYEVDIDNTANAAIEYVKLYDNAGPTVGTTAPNVILPIAASSRKRYKFEGGLVFATGLSAACVTAAGTAGTTGPTSDVVLRIICT